MERAQAEAIRDAAVAGLDPIDAAVAVGQLYVDNPDLYAALHGAEIAPGIHIQNPGPDADRMVSKLIRNVQANLEDYVHGMQNPRRDPVQAAVRAEGKYENKLQEAIREKRYGKGVRAQDYPAAVAAAIEGGGAALSSGVQRRESKIRRAFQDLAPRLGALSQQIQQMPQDTDAQREARMTAARKGMIAIGKQRRGSVGT